MRLSGGREWGKQPELRIWNWQGMETLMVLLGQRVPALAWQRRVRDVNGVWVEEKGSVELNSMAHRGLYWFCFLKHTCFNTYTHIFMNPGPAHISKYHWFNPCWKDMKRIGVCLCSGCVCVEGAMHAHMCMWVEWVGRYLVDSWFRVFFHQTEVDRGPV